jgi:rfaE bifunctional protein nucleotidyltransferase chain/domain
MNKIFVNGTFDLIHPAHLDMIIYSKSLGDYLLVAIDSDSRVRQLKGENRPVNSEFSRKYLMENLKSVDEVKIFNSEEDLINIIKEYSPDIMIVGSDYRNKKVIGCEYARELRFFERNPRHSSTKIIESIRCRR